MSASLLCVLLATLTPGAVSYLLKAPHHCPHQALAASPVRNQFLSNCFSPMATRLPKLWRLTTSPRQSFLALKMSGAEASIPDLEQAFEAALIASLPDASEQELEEVLAILTTSARSLERRLKQGREQAVNAKERLSSNLRQKLLDDEALLSPSQWDQVISTFDALQPPAGSNAFDASVALVEIEAQLQGSIASIAQKPGVLSRDDAAELKAIVTTVCRSYSRRLAQGHESPSSRAELLAAVEGGVKRRAVDEEGLIDASRWDTVRAAPASAPIAPVSSPIPAPAATPQTAAATPEQASRAAALVVELRELFPSHDPALLADAAARGGDMEGAVFIVLSAARPPTATDKEEESAPAPVRKTAAGGAGERRECATPGVTTGACSFGLCFDIVARDRDIVVTGIRTASSPGLNWGQGQALRVAVFATRDSRSARGAELDRSQWRQVGAGSAVQLPMVSWADRAPEYGPIPLDEPVTVPAGTTRGFLVHTNDLYGLVMGVGMGAGGCDEALGVDEDDAEPLRPGMAVASDDALEVRAGYAMGAAVFEEFDGVAIPSAGAFAGVIEYVLQ